MLAYAVAFTYEAALLGHYGLPNAMVQVDLTRVFVAAFGLLSLLNIAFHVVLNFPTRQPRWLHFVAAVLIAGLFVSGLVVSLIRPSPLWVRVTLAILAPTCSYFLIVFPILKYRAFPFVDRFRQAPSRPPRPAAESPNVAQVWSWYLRRSGYNPRAFWNGVIVLIILFSSAWIFGGTEAENQKIFLVTGEKERFALLRPYPAYLIAGELTPTGDSLTGSFVFLPSVGDTGRKWTLRRMGPLHQRVVGAR